MDITKIGEKKFSAIMDIVVWQKVKNTDKPPLAPLSMCCSQVLMVIFLFVTTLIKGKGGHLWSILNVCHILCP